MTTSNHPSPAQLALFAAGRGSDEVAEHVRRCARCRRVAPTEGRRRVPESLPDYRVSSEVLRILAQPAPASDPAPGELWRIEWDGEAAVAAIVAAQPQIAWTAAVDTEPRDEDPEPAAVPIASSSTVLGCVLRVWPAAPVAVARAALDRRLDLPLATPERAAETAEPESWGLQQALARLRWLAEHASRAMEDPGEPGWLAEWLRERGATRAGLAKAGLPPRAASMILQARQRPTTEQLLQIARALDADPLALHRMLGTLPGGLLAELHQPHRRAQLGQRAAAEGLPEAQLRRDAAAAIAGPQATRRQRGSAAPDWAALVDEYFGR